MANFTQTRIDRYELRERIGSGGTARVYKAYDANLDRLVAIKVLYEHLAEDSTFKERFEREAKLIASFNHPNIVQVYDFNVQNRDDGALYYMVMSYIPGRTLRAELEELTTRGMRLPQDRIMQIMLNMTDALGYAHARDMVHRDVKPGNIILRDDGQAILTDFGIARMIRAERLTQQGVTTGTPVYMSPEQANGDPGDARSDLYSLAIILFEMLAGQPPFNDDSNLSVMLKHLTTPIPMISSFLGVNAPKLDTFLSRALAKDPDDRFQTAESFATALKSVFLDEDEDPTTLLPSGANLVAVKSDQKGETSLRTSLALPALSNRRSLLRITAAALAIGIVILLALALLFSRNQSSTETVSPTVPVSVPSMTGDIYFNASFSPGDPENAYWQQDETDLLVTRITADGYYHLENRVPGTADTSIMTREARYSDVSISMDAMLDADSQPASAYGIVFRYQDEDNYNVFAVDGVGRFSIWTRLNGVWHELRDAPDQWTMNEAVKPIGETNRLSLIILHDQISGFVNNRSVVRLTESTFAGGRVGIYIASDDGDANVMVDRYRVFSSVPSMTGPSG